MYSLHITLFIQRIYRRNLLKYQNSYHMSFNYGQSFDHSLYFLSSADSDTLVTQQEISLLWFREDFFHPFQC